jgi:NADH:ubiquinone oxidoreductase subunit 6 (subunit J)
MLIDNDRVSHWLAGAVCSWSAFYLLVCIPIFHLWLKAPVAKIAVYVGACCVVQLMATPWLFSARATPQNPVGNVALRSKVVVVWLSLTSILLMYIGQRGLPTTRENTELRLIMFGTPVLLGLVGLVTVAIRFRERKAEQGYR